MDKAREAAVFALERTRRNGAWTSALSDAMKTKYDLDSRSLSLAVSISLGVLQNTALLDYYIDLNSKSASKIEPKVRDIMRSGAYQLIFMDKIPASAAVNESVALCKKLGYSRASGFCNAVLRERSRPARTSFPRLPERERRSTFRLNTAIRSSLLSISLIAGDMMPPRRSLRPITRSRIPAFR